MVSPAGAAGFTGIVVSGDQVYLVPWYTGPGGAIDLLMTRMTVASCAAHLGLYAAQHVRMITPGGLLVTTSMALTTATVAASVGFTATPNAIAWLAIQLPESRTLAGATFLTTCGWDPSSLRTGNTGLVCSYAYASGLPTTLTGVPLTRIGAGTDLPPFLGVHYA
jgi:hypothetical protein